MRVDKNNIRSFGVEETSTSSFNAISVTAAVQSAASLLEAREHP